MKCCSITAYKQAQKYKTETQKYKTCYKSTVRVITLTLTLTLTVHVKHLYGDTCQSMAGILAPPYIILSIRSYLTNHLGYSVQMKHASRYGQVLGVDMKIPPPGVSEGRGAPYVFLGTPSYLGNHFSYDTQMCHVASCGLVSISWVSCIIDWQVSPSRQCTDYV